jgi:CheY-like chemotaxis protein
MFLDLNMPKKNGFEVLQWLRQQPGLKRITVNILSASSRGEDVTRAFDCGANVYLVKPSKIEALVEMLKTWRSLGRFSVFPSIE